MKALSGAGKPGGTENAEMASRMAFAQVLVLHCVVEMGGRAGT